MTHMYDDPYKELFDEISNAIQKLNKMVCELASRTLTVKEYQEFAEMFQKPSEKERKQELIKKLQEDQKNEEQ